MFSNDPKTPQYRLNMTGMVEVLASFEPDRVYFRSVVKGSTQTQLVELTGKLADTIKLGELVSSKPEELSAQIEKHDNKTKLKVTLKAPDKEGRFSGTITVTTNVETPKELRLNVSAQITGDIVLDKTFALFPHFTKGQTQTIEINSRSLTNKPFRITKVEDPAGNVSGKAKKTDQGWKIELKLIKKPDKNRGKLIFHTNRRDQPTISLNYSVRGSMRLPSRTLVPKNNPTKPHVNFKTPPFVKLDKAKMKKLPIRVQKNLPLLRPKPEKKE